MDTNHGYYCVDIITHTTLAPDVLTMKNMPTSLPLERAVNTL